MRHCQDVCAKKSARVFPDGFALFFCVDDKKNACAAGNMRRILPFVADTDGEAVCDQRAVQRIFDAGDADVFHTVRQRQYGKRIALAGGKGNCAVGDQMQPRLAPIKRRLRAMSAGKSQTLDVSPADGPVCRPVRSRAGSPQSPRIQPSAPLPSYRCRPFPPAGPAPAHLPAARRGRNQNRRRADPDGCRHFARRRSPGRRR